MATTLGFSPLVDLIFKLLFGNPKHPKLAAVLLDTLLAAAGFKPVSALTFLNPFSRVEFTGDKQIIVDILLRDVSGQEYHIEMQVRQNASLEQRILDSWSRAYAGQIERGQDVRHHRPLVSIWLVKESILDEPSWLDIDDIRRRSDLAIRMRHFMIVTVQLERWQKLFSAGSEEPWRALQSMEERITLDAGMRERLTVLMRFLTESQDWLQGKLPDFTRDWPWIKEALKIMNVFTKSGKAKALYIHRMNNEIALKSLLNEGKEEGLAEGMAKGIAEGITRGMAMGKAEGEAEGEAKGMVKGMAKGMAMEKAKGMAKVARRMKAAGMDSATIRDITGIDPASLPTP